MRLPDAFNRGDNLPPDCRQCDIDRAAGDGEGGEEEEEKDLEEDEDWKEDDDE